MQQFAARSRRPWDNESNSTMLKGLELCTKFESELDTAEMGHLAELIHIAFPDDDEGWWDESGQNTPTLHFLGKMEGRIVSNVSLVEREIAVNGRKYIIGGIGGVATLPEWKRKGIAASLMNAATQFILENPRFEFGMLFCETRMIHYYARFGFEVIVNAVFLTHKGMRERSNDTIMILRTGHRNFPEGVVELPGGSW